MTMTKQEHTTTGQRSITNKNRHKWWWTHGLLKLH